MLVQHHHLSQCSFSIRCLHSKNVCWCILSYTRLSEIWLYQMWLLLLIALLHLYQIAVISNLDCLLSGRMVREVIVIPPVWFYYAVARPSDCLSSVTLVHLTQAVVVFGKISAPFGTLAVHWHPRKILQRSSQGNPSVGGLKHNMGSQI